MSIKTIPIWKWALLLLAGFVLSFLMYAVAQTFTDFIGLRWLQLAAYIVVSGVMLGLYALFVRWFEKAPAGDIPAGRILPETLKGLGLGAGYFCVLVLIMFAAGLYKIDAFGCADPVTLILAFFMFLMVAVGEEIIFRGVLFRWIDEKWGFAVALIVSSLLFGLMHIFQPGATMWSSIAIAVEAGLLLGAAYKYSRTLWLPIGIHWGWNFFQGNIFGFAVSGGDAGSSLIQSSVQGPVILTGGAFGAEASVIAMVLGVLLSVWFIVKVAKR